MLAGVGGAVLLVLAVVVALLVGGEDQVRVDRDPLGTAQPRPALAASALGGLAAALRSGDGDAARALAPAGDAATAEVLGGVAANAAALGLERLDLRYVDEVSGVGADGRWVAAVDASWSARAFGSGTASTELDVTFALDGDRAAVIGFGGGDARLPTWLAGPAAVRSADGTTVIAATGDEAASRYLGLARRALPQVRAVLPDPDRPLVVDVPADDAALHRALDAAPGTYSGVAAVTATVDGSLAPSAPVHVVVNEAVLGALGPRGAQVVMTHEAVHVATGAATTVGVPLWLLEGFADYVALRGTDLPLSTTAAQALQRVRRDGLPDALPGPEEFGTTETHLGATYEAAWIAATVLADAAGEDALVRYYADVSAGADAEQALRRVAGFGTAELTARWRDRLAALAS